MKHRLLLGWVNDNSPVALCGKPWPIIDMDEATIETYREYFPIVRDLGYTGITLWGLYVSHAWPAPLVASAFDERRGYVDQVLELARKNSLKALHGLGVYGWGFADIIKYDPSCARNEGRRAWGAEVAENGLVMCYHEPSAREWMHRVIDLTLKDFGAEGIGFQAGDLGRCLCHQCRQMEDLEYFSLIVDEAAQYARSIKPDILLGHSCWGVNLSGPREHLVRLGQNLDFLTDVTDQLVATDVDYRTLPCAIGSLGGAVFVPPQRWERNRWYLPHAKYTLAAIQRMKERQADAFEFFMGPLNNPQYESMTDFVARALAQPESELGDLMLDSVNHLYQPVDRESGAMLVHLILEIEAAYLSARGGWPNGEFDYEPLVSEQPGAPIYLHALEGPGISTFRRTIESLKPKFEALAPFFGRKEPLEVIGQCLGNMLADADRVVA